MRASSSSANSGDVAPVTRGSLTVTLPRFQGGIQPASSSACLYSVPSVMRPLTSRHRPVPAARAARIDAKLEGYDVEGVLAFAEHVILNAAQLWIEFSSDQKQRLQKVLFPEGLTFAGEEFGTAATCPLFKLLEKTEGDVNRSRFCPV
jgi:hypothetical protein